MEGQNEKTINIFFIFIIIVFVFNCSKDSTGPDDNGDEDEVIISENVVVIEDMDLSDPIIDSTMYTFTFVGDPPDINVGDVIVGQTGLGYLRKVISVEIEGNEIILETEQASLTDVIEQCNIQNTIEFSINNRSKIDGWHCNYLAEGVTLQRGGIDFDDLVLFSGNVDNVNLDVTIPDGYFEFEPTLNHEIEIEWFQIQHLLITAEGNMQFDCDIELTCSAPVNYNHEINIAEFTSPIFYIWVVPCVFELSFVAGFETNLELTGTVSAGFDSDASLEYGAEYYSSSGWSEIWDKSFDFAAHPIQWGYIGSVNATCYIKPRLSLLIASVAGPYMETEPYLQFNGDITPPNWQWELLGGVNGNLGFEVEIYTYTLADYYTTLLNWETIIASDNGTINDPFILVTSPNGGENWEMGTSHYITWNDNISSNVSIKLYRSDSYISQISSSTYSDGSYNWSIPTTLTESSYYKIKIASTTNSSIYDYSNNCFTIFEGSGQAQISAWFTPNNIYVGETTYFTIYIAESNGVEVIMDYVYVVSSLGPVTELIGTEAIDWYNAWFGTNIIPPNGTISANDNVTPDEPFTVSFTFGGTDVNNNYVSCTAVLNAINPSRSFINLGKIKPKTNSKISKIIFHK